MKKMLLVLAIIGKLITLLIAVSSIKEDSKGGIASKSYL